MTPLILELATKAELYVDVNGKPWPRNMNGEDIEGAYQKFAELIVRECVKVMYDNAIERKVPPDIKQTPTHYAVAVLEHFGVEE